MIIKNSALALKNVPKTVENCINAFNMYKSGSIMILYTAITAVSNTLEKIYLGGTSWYEPTFAYHNEKNDDFGMLFQQYTASNVDNIYYP